MYMPPLPEELQYQSSWDYRRDLLKERIELVNADVVCFQEIAPRSFEKDFEFMQELGYDGVEVFRKGRFRPATFWKTSACELAMPAVHKDRCLLTAFRLNSSSKEDDNEPSRSKEAQSTTSNWYVCNCHLQAGKQGPRRVRQINEALKGIMTMARKQKEPNPESLLRVIVCGDFNGGQECGAVRFLEDGFIDENFREDGEPVSSGLKKMPLDKPMVDAATSVPDRDPPATLVVSELMSNLMEEASYENPVLSQSMLERLERIYKTLASDREVMNLEDVEKWLRIINRDLGRGDEYRQAAKQMGYVDNYENPDESYEEKKKRVKLPEEGVLTLEGFINVYRKELEAGKFWGIGHDMAVLGDPLPDDGVFTARFDRIYYSQNLRPTALLDTTSDIPCPNGREPSDHLPVAASFQVVS